MDQTQFQELMDEIKASRTDFQGQIADLKREVQTVQERTSTEVAQKIGKSSYQFKRKGNEIQFGFNSGIEESLSSARRELKKIEGVGDVQKESLKRVDSFLEEGIKSLEKRQKHIKVADRSDYGWATVEHYDSHPLADNSDDEKRLEKAEKEAERVANKRRRGGGTGAKRKRGWSDTGGPSSRREPQGLQLVAPPPPVPQGQGGQPRPRVLGPCFTCGGFGHLARTCPKKPLYPLDQPVVSSAEGSHVVTVPQGIGTVDGTGVNDVINVNSQAPALMVVGVQVNNQKAFDLSSDSEGVNACRKEGDTCNEIGVGRFWEAEACVPTAQESVQGKLRQNLAFWKDVLQAPPPVVDCIENGYRLPLKFLPPPHSQSNHKSAELHHEFVDEAIQKLVQDCCVIKVDQKPHLCSPLSVVSNSSNKLRLVLNLRYLNQFLYMQHFKYEDLRIAALLFEKDEYLFKFDLKSGYHHVDIYPEHQKYLGFQWNKEGGEGGFYMFAVLPFGLSTACYIFTKLMRPLVRFWRGRGLKAIVYLDDGIIAVKGKSRALSKSTQVQCDLQHAGFVVNVEKSVWDPSTDMEWLGFKIDLAKGEFSVPEHKLSKLKSQLQEASKSQVMQARLLASLIGKIMSMSLALGPVTRLMTRSLYAALNSKSAWCQKLTMTPAALGELTFWFNEVSKFNGQYIWPKPSAVRVVYSDASATGFGGYTVEHGHLIANGHWSEEEAKGSSTLRELKAVRMVLESFQSKLGNERIRWFTDNQNVVRIVQYGSKNAALQSEALAIFSLCIDNHIHIEPEWIPREQNQLADYYSRIVDHDDWMLNPYVFNWLDAIWGPHTIDRFANPSNNQVVRFNSRFWTPNSEAVDTFTCNWGGENNWWCPPVHLVPRVIRHGQNTNARGTLVVPQWLSSPFWPLLFPDGVMPAEFVKEYMELPCTETLILPGQLGTSLFKGLPNTPVLALRIEFHDPNHQYGLIK